MTYSFVYWFFMLLLLLFGGAWSYRTDRASGFVGYAPVGSFFLVFVLLVLLGIKVFGWPLQG